MADNMNTLQEAIDPREQPNQNLARGLRILESFDRQHPEWGVRELARALDTNPTTTYRLLTTLENFGYVEQSKSSQRYRLGAKTVRLASHYAEQNPLPEIARRVFEQHSSRFEHAFYLGVLNNFKVVYTAVLESRSVLRISAHVGERIPLHTTALGKVLLAAQDQEFVEHFLAAVPLGACTPKSKTSPDALREEIEDVRRSGYAVSLGENFEDIGAVGVPLYNAKGEVIAGLSLGFPLHWLQSGKLEMSQMLQIAHELSSGITLRMEGNLP